MADVKISALPAATTPLGGTEVLPIVQSGTTKKVSIADVTAGRAMSASSLTLSSPLGVASGGTGLTSLTAGRIPYGDGTSAFGNSANLFFDGTNLGVGTSTIVQKLTVNNGSISVSDGFGYTFGSSSAYISGNSGSNFINFVTSSSEKMRLDASGNLGIGTSSPGFKLDVSGSGIVQRLTSSSGSVYLGFVNSGNSQGYIGYEGTGGTNLTFYTANSERMRIDGSGYVGIGTTTPRAPLAFPATVSTAGVPNKIRLFDDGASNLYGFNVSSALLEIISGLGGGIAFYADTSERVRITPAGNVGIGTTSPSYKLDVSGNSVVGRFNGSATAFFDMAIGGTTNGRFGTNGFATNDFFCGTTGATPLVFVTNNAERARIDSSGNLLVGTTVANAKVYGSGGGNSPIGRFDATLTSGYTSEVFQVIAGQPSGTGFKVAAFYLDNAAAYASYIRGDGTIFAVSTTIQAVSDARLKENVRDASEGLDTILALKPRRFDWKAGEGNGKKNQIGFIAQEVETVFPDAVDIWEKPEDETEYKSVGASMLVPVLVKAIQELAAEVAMLKGQLNG